MANQPAGCHLTDSTTDVRKAIAATGVVAFNDDAIDEEIREELQDGLLIY